MPQVARDQVIRVRRIRALQKLIVAWILGFLKYANCSHQPPSIFDQLHKLKSNASFDLELRAREDFLILSDNCIGYIKPRWPSEGKRQNGTLKAVRFERGRDQDIRIKNEAKRNHRGFEVRACLA
jgi:hypothetical protein